MILLILAVLLMLISFFGFISCTGDPQTESRIPDKPNIVFILTDDLGWKDIGVYGSPFHETPNIDRLAHEGMLFTDAYVSAAVCSPVRASLMTGKYPARLNLTDWIPGRQYRVGPNTWNTMLPPDFEQYLSLDEVSIARAMKEGGYKTGFFGKWHLGEEAYYPEHHGFDVNKGGWAAGNPRSHIYDSGGVDRGYFSPYGNPRLEDGPDGEYLTDRLTTESINFMRENKDQPMLVYLSYYSPHTPMEAKEEDIARYELKAEKIPPVNSTGSMWLLAHEDAHARSRIIQNHPVYAAMIHSIDENVGRVLESLEELGIKDETIVIFTSDHGGLSTGDVAVTSSFPLRGGKGWLHEGGVRVPLIIKWPGVTESGSVSTEPVMISNDFYPTALEMANLPLRPEQHKDGISIAPLLSGEKSSLDRKALFWHYPHYSNHHRLPPAGAIRKGPYKLIEYYDTFDIELYNLEEDIGELNDLADLMPDIASDLKETLHRWRESVDAQMPTPRDIDALDADN